MVNLVVVIAASRTRDSAKEPSAFDLVPSWGCSSLQPMTSMSITVPPLRATAATSSQTQQRHVSQVAWAKFLFQNAPNTPFT